MAIKTIPWGTLVRRRLAGLEARDRESAEVVDRIAEETRDRTEGIEIVATGTRLLSGQPVATTVLAIIATGIAAI